MFGLKINLFRKLYASLRNISGGKHHQGNDHPVSSNPEMVDPTFVDASLSGWFKHETAELLEGFKISSEDVVLDVGCGDSPFLHFCAMQGAEVIFADIDPLDDPQPFLDYFVHYVPAPREDGTG